MSKFRKYNAGFNSNSFPSETAAPQKFLKGEAICSEPHVLKFAPEAWLMLYMLISMSDGNKQRTSADWLGSYNNDSPVGGETGAVFVGYKEIGADIVHVPYIPVTNQYSLNMLTVFPSGEYAKCQKKCYDFIANSDEPELHEYLDPSKYVTIPCMFHHHVNISPNNSGSLIVNNDLYTNNAPRNDMESFVTNSNGGKSPHISFIGCIRGLSDFNTDNINVAASTTYHVIESTNFFMLFNSPSISRVHLNAIVELRNPPIINDDAIIDMDRALELGVDSGKVAELDLVATTTTLCNSTAIFTNPRPKIIAPKLTFNTVLSTYAQLMPNGLCLLF